VMEYHHTGGKSKQGEIGMEQTESWPQLAGKIMIFEKLLNIYVTEQRPGVAELYVLAMLGALAVDSSTPFQSVRPCTCKPSNAR